MRPPRSCECSVVLGLVLAGAGCTGGDTTQPPASSVPAVEEPPAPPNPYVDSPSRFGSVPLHAGFSPDPRVVAGRAAGEVKARSIHRKCRGWISETPDYLLDASTAFLKLYILGRSRADVLLVVRTPDGAVSCNDDRQGTRDPMIRGPIPIGTTKIWVGVKEEGGAADYRLGFSEVKWKSSSIPLPDDG